MIVDAPPSAIFSPQTGTTMVRETLVSPTVKLIRVCKGVGPSLAPITEIVSPENQFSFTIEGEKSVEVIFEGDEPSRKNHTPSVESVSEPPFVTSACKYRLISESKSALSPPG